MILLLCKNLNSTLNATKSKLSKYIWFVCIYILAIKNRNVINRNLAEIVAQGLISNSRNVFFVAVITDDLCKGCIWEKDIERKDIGGFLFFSFSDFFIHIKTIPHFILFAARDIIVHIKSALYQQAFFNVTFSAIQLNSFYYIKIHNSLLHFVVTDNLIGSFSNISPICNSEMELL